MAETPIGPGAVPEEQLFAFDTSTLGNPVFVSGQLQWSPPAGLTPAQIALVQQSLRHFNDGLARGEHEVEVTAAGKIQVKPERKVK